MDETLQKIANMTAWDACVIFARHKDGKLYSYSYGTGLSETFLNTLSLSVLKEMHASSLPAKEPK